MMVTSKAAKKTVQPRPRLVTNSSLPPGNYQQTCTCKLDGPILDCQCLNNRQQRVRTRAFHAFCKYYINHNGKLFCRLKSYARQRTHSAPRRASP